MKTACPSSVSAALERVHAGPRERANESSGETDRHLGVAGAPQDVHGEVVPGEALVVRCELGRHVAQRGEERAREAGLFELREDARDVGGARARLDEAPPQVRGEEPAAEGAGQELAGERERDQALREPDAEPAGRDEHELPHASCAAVRPRCGQPGAPRVAHQRDRAIAQDVRRELVELPRVQVEVVTCARPIGGSATEEIVAQHAVRSRERRDRRVKDEARRAHPVHEHHRRSVLRTRDLERRRAAAELHALHRVVGA